MHSKRYQQLHYWELLRGGAGDPDQRLGTLPLVQSLERRQVLDECNNAKTEYPQDQCLHHLIEAQARRTPDATAVAFGRCSLSYDQLNSRANLIAHRLQKLGVGPDVLVGFCVERSPEMFVGMLAILKAGGAYVPLDEANPDERLCQILSEVQPRVVLTQRRQSRRFSESCPVLFVDEELNSSGADTSDLRAETTPDHLAYVIFTSGSTGMPKGVLVSHRSLVNHGTAMARYFELRSSDRVLQFAASSFDVAAEEIFPTWISGATVVPWPAAPGLTTVSALIKFVESQGITVLNLPAPFWQEWVADLDRLTVPPSVRLLIVGTDKVSSEKFLKCRKQIGKHVRLCNAYGVTEATITATIYEPAGEFDPGAADCVPIGRPIANTEAYVLDQNLNLLPIGVTGELYLGGACLARGYLNRPELTVERFIAHPFGVESGARIYKTGDLARYLPDGNIEFLGRIDHQVKLRGFRIELGEIKSVLSRMAGVQGAEVVAREDKPGDKRLVAYVVCEQPGACTAEDLRMRLRRKLPDHMVPSAIVLLEGFPLTPGGKVDLQALPQPEADRVPSEDSFVACRTSTERQLAEIWEEILSVKPIGLRNNFFDLGGDSLLGLRLMSQIERTFGKSFPPAALFDAPTIELMSKLITDDSGERQWPIMVPLQPNGSKPPFFWINGDGSNAFLPGYLGPDQPVYGFRHQGSDGRRARYRTIKEMAAHYLSEIRSVRSQGPYFLGGYCIGGVIAFEIAQTLRKEGEAVPLLVLMAPDRPVNLPAKVSPTKPSDDRPERTVQRQIPRSRGAELRQRLGRFARLSARQKARHLFLGLSGRVDRYVGRYIASPATRIVREIGCRICFVLGARLPIALRDFHIDSVYEQAAKGYVAESYDGFVVLFKPLQDPVDLTSWQILVGNGLEIHHIPGNHADVMSNRDHVKIWADVLMRHLQRPS